ncbi:hypothetical protein D3C73_1262930 [compost metagenome]
MPGGDDLCHFVDGRTGEDTEAFLIKRQPLELLVQMVQPRVGKDRQRTEHHHGAHGDRHLIGIGFQYRFGSHDRSRTADAAAGTDQHGGMSVEAKHFLAQPAGEQESGGER